MTNAGLPVPPGLHDHDRGLQRLLRGRRAAARRAVGRRPRGRARRSSARPARASATPPNPLLVSVRSGAKFSMPGMMDTVLNLGLNEETLAGPDRADRQRALRLGRLPPLHPDVRPDRDGRRRRAVRRGARAAQGTRAASTQDTDLDADALRELAGEFKSIVREPTGRDFPTDPLRAARPGDQGRLRVVVRQARPRLPRVQQDRRTTSGTAVNVVTMVFGNMGDDSGTGVAFTRDPNTGEKRALRRVPDQRPGRGRRGRHPHAAADQPDARRACPRPTPSSSGSASASSSTTGTSRTSSSPSSAAACTCSRRGSAKRTAAAAVRIAADMVDEGIITERRRSQRIEPAHVDQLLRDQFDPVAPSRRAAHRGAA